MSSGRFFDEREDAYIRTHVRQLGCPSVARHLGRSTSGIRKRRRALGIPARECHRWTPKEDAVLLAGRGRLLRDVARQLRRRVVECSSRARILGIRSWAWHRNGDSFRPDRNGYRVVGFKRKNGQSVAILEHKLVAEEMLGRPLRRGEVVHHINTDRLDNRRENLVVLGGPGAHRRVHTSVERLIPDLLLRGVITFDRDLGGYRLCTTPR